MKSLHPLLLVLAVNALAAPACAAQTDSHAGHHPTAAASATPPATPAPPAASTTADAPNPVVVRMDAQMQAMQAMHEKMMAAKTPAERNALMAEHMKVMQDGMNMMNSMSSDGTGNMNMMSGTPQCDTGDMKPGTATRHQMMGKRMEMMQAMMQMMMDRMSATSAK